MNSVRFCLVLLIFLPGVSCAFNHKVVPSCSEHETVCSFKFDVRYKFSMVYNDEKGYAKPIVIRNGTLLKRSSYNKEEFELLTPKELEQVLTVDGVYKLLFSINGEFPGPPIIVYEGQTIEVLVRNHLSNEVFTIHWHGMHQKHTPWMDGASMVSQCPIGPGQNFMYRFKADPAGTHWYHAHQGSMRGDGLAGPLIVLPRKKRTNLPRVEDDFIIVIQEWNRNKSSLENHEIHAWNMHLYADDFNCTESCYIVTHTTDGTSMGMEPFHSGLINGKGHHYPDKTEKPLVPVLPLEIFKVKPNKNYRFRIINAATFVSFRLSIDEHLFRVIATDGHDVEPEAAQSVVIASGERYDVLVQTKMNSRKNFFIRAESMELKSQFLDPIYPGVVKAIFRYEDAPDSLPDTTRQKCTRENACKVINCPNKLYPRADHVNCFSVANLLSTQETINSCPVPVSQNGERIREDFLNFHFTTANPESQNPVMKATINGHVFTTPTCPPQSTYGPKASSCINDCNKQKCLKQQCSCTHLLNYDNTSLGSAVQLVLLSRDGLRGATDHPIHIHGHSFHVLKTVYPELDPTTGLVTNFSRDIECESETCLTPRWSNKEWAGGNLPDLNLQNPPLKDTVVVPRGGYVVLRFYLDNPGYWFLHCHMDAHQMEGMTLIIKEGQRIFHPKPPKRFPSCGDFTWSLDEYKEITDARIANLGNENNSTDNNDPQNLSNTDLLWDLTIAVLITCSFGAVLFLLCLFKYYLSNCLIERRDQESPYSMLKQNNRAKPQSYGSS
nr:L-ascorbate oxidase [Crassostrea gigas]